MGYAGGRSKAGRSTGGNGGDVGTLPQVILQIEEAGCFLRAGVARLFGAPRAVGVVGGPGDRGWAHCTTRWHEPATNCEQLTSHILYPDFWYIALK